MSSPQSLIWFKKYPHQKNTKSNSHKSYMTSNVLYGSKLLSSKTHKNQPFNVLYDLKFLIWLKNYPLKKTQKATPTRLI